MSPEELYVMYESSSKERKTREAVKGSSGFIADFPQPITQPVFDFFEPDGATVARASVTRITVRNRPKNDGPEGLEVVSVDPLANEENLDEKITIVDCYIEPNPEKKLPVSLLFLLAMISGPASREPCLGDAEERFKKDTLKFGSRRATWLFCRDLCGSVLPTLICVGRKAFKYIFWGTVVEKVSKFFLK